MSTNQQQQPRCASIRTDSSLHDEAERHDEEEEVIDDWGLATANFQLFAQHDIGTVYMKQSVQYHDDTTNSLATSNDSNDDNSSKSDPPVNFLSFSLLCVEALTPIDMIHLGSGIHDATGHCVWTGAFLFLASLESSLFSYFNSKALDKNDEAVYTTTAEISNNNFQQVKLMNQRRCRSRRRVLELGCGTGIGSIGVWTAYQKYHGNEDCDCDNCVHQPWITMTDADPEALDLCRRNCQLNHIPTDSYTVQSLYWGKQPLPECIASIMPYDTVFATDVLYDIKLLRPLFETANTCLDNHGHFILAHVPRACYDSNHPPVPSLDDYICQCAESCCGFYLERIIRPTDCGSDFFATSIFPKDALNSTSLQEMETIGAAIFVFQKRM
jgi:Lysine methyltransferase